MIEIRNLQKVVDQRTVLQIPALKVGAGEVLGLVGQAGSGKGALIDLLLGRARPSAGVVRVAGLDAWRERRALSGKVGVLFPEDGLYLRRSCLGNLQFYAHLYGLPASRAREALAWVGLADQERAAIGDLRSGMRRRLALGRAILHAPPVLVLMEPFARCDEASIALIQALLIRLAEEGAAILILASEGTQLSACCDQVRSLRDGRLGESLMAGEATPADRAFKLPIRLEGSVVLISPAEIYFAQAEGGRAYLHTPEGRIPTQFTLGEIEGRLGRSGFFRAHRSYLVNLQHVKEVIPFTRNSFNLRLNDAAGTLIPLSKAAAAELRELLGF